VQRGRPAFCSAGEIGQDVAFERVPVGLAKQLAGLGLGESQVRRAQLGELAMRPQSPDRDHGDTATREDDRQAFGRATSSRAMNDVRDVVGYVEVVEDKGGAVL
jgi:hypothetical protein